ncbi:MAG TPA: glycosyltransferase family 4 protein [Steroidobacteraceae bacterium]|nr:glycosyltransferase family 4 protein [Steroidobacteraceae bacterium]
MTVIGEPWVDILQPVVPHYRLPLFDSLFDRLNGKLRVRASRNDGGMISSVTVQRPWLDLEHDCVPLLRGRLYWQRDLTPRDDARQGDVAVIAGNPRYLSTFRFAERARRRGMGLVWWGHGWSPTSTRLHARIRHRLMARMDAVLAYTEEEAVELRRILPNVAVLGAQNAIDQTPIRRARAEWPEARLRGFRTTHALDGRRVLLFCGRLRQEISTGIDLLIDAMPALVRSDPSWLVVVVGDGKDRERLVKLTRQRGVADNFRWVGAEYEENALAPWFLSSLGYVYPGSIGLGLLHAFGYGLPVITHSDRRRHGPEIAALIPDWNGLEFDAASPATLADQVLRLSGDPALRERLGRNALETVTSRYSIDVMVDRFVSAIDIARSKSLRSGA